MKFAPPLVKSQLIKRYKRFLADVIHPELGEITVHCANTGSMKNCWDAGWNAWLLKSDNPKRKYSYSWVLTENDQGQFIGINTHFANQIVFEGIVAGRVEALRDFQQIQQEVKYGQENSRIDIWLTDAEQRQTFIEVKSVTLQLNGHQGYFPDAVSQRGQKHLRELIHCVEQGHRAVLFFLIQHSGIESVQAAAQIDPQYAELLSIAIAAGVEVMAYKTDISPRQITLSHPVNFIASQ